MRSSTRLSTTKAPKHEARSHRGGNSFRFFGLVGILLTSVSAGAAGCQKSHAKGESDPEVLMMKAQALIKTGRATEAGKMLERLADRKDLAPLQRFQLAALLGEAQRYKRAVELFNSLPPAYPDAFSRDYGLALAYFGDGQYAMVIKTLTNLEGGDITKPDAFRLLGLAYAKVGEVPRAYEAFERGISFVPKDAKNYLTYAAISVQHREYKRAAQVLSSGLGQVSRDYRLSLARGVVEILLSDFTEAEADCERAMAIDPSDSRVYLALGLSYMGQSRYDQAAEVFRNGIRQRFKDALLYYFLSDVLLRKSVGADSALYSQALSAAESCLVIDPKFAYCYLERARMELMTGQLGQAIADLERARSFLPDSRSVLYHLAVAYRRAGKQSEAEALLARVKGLTIREFQIYRTMLLVDIMNSLYASPS